MPEVTAKQLRTTNKQKSQLGADGPPHSPLLYTTSCAYNYVGIYMYRALDQCDGLELRTVDIRVPGFGISGFQRSQQNNKNNNQITINKHKDYIFQRSQQTLQNCKGILNVIQPPPLAQHTP